MKNPAVAIKPNESKIARIVATELMLSLSQLNPTTARRLKRSSARSESHLDMNSATDGQ